MIVQVFSIILAVKKKTSKNSVTKTTTKAKKTKKTSKSKKTKKSGENVHSDIDSGIVIVDDDLVVDKEAEKEERRAFLEEARSQEASDQKPFIDIKITV